MKYNVKLHESNLVLSANDSRIFLNEFAKLPEGEYTVAILSDESRSGKHFRKVFNRRLLQIATFVLEVVCIIASLSSIVALWILLAALA